MKNFIENFYDICNEKGWKISFVYKNARIGKSRFSKIHTQYADNKNFQIKRNSAIALGLALELPLAKMQEFLSTAGYVLSENIMSDVIIMDSIKNRRFSVVEVNGSLYEAGLEMITMSD